MDQRVDKLNRELKPLFARELRWWTWKRVLVATVVILAVLFIGSYAYNWQWTGFRDHGRLWDWLSLLLVPVIVTVLPIWYSLRQSPGSDKTGKQHDQQPVQSAKDHS